MKTLFIVGPTATGKTDLALSLVPRLLRFSGVLGVDILSADSKQAYIGEDIVTGKDKEKIRSQCEQYKGKLEIFGIDVVKPDEEWSVSHFLRYAKTVLETAEKQHRFVVVVGGTGQYLSSLVAPPATAVVPRNDTLRRELDKLSLRELERRLSELDPKKWERMNPSDRQNPRRLVRAIEVATSSLRDQARTQRKIAFTLPSLKVLWIGLTAARESLEARIGERVRQRIAMGAVEETRLLLAAYPTWTKEARSAIGYHDIESFLRGEGDSGKLTSMWVLHEVQYAKQQLTWFRKKKDIEWFDCTDGEVKTKVVNKVLDWYTNTT